MEYVEVTSKTVDDAITEACRRFLVTSDRLDYEVIDKGTSGFLGFAAKPAIIRARVKDEDEDVAEEIAHENVAPVKEETEKEQKVEISESKKSDVEEKISDESQVSVEPVDPKEFLTKVFDAMGMKVNIEITSTEEEMNIELSGDEMGVLIGKRGQTLDSLQYLTSLVVNKGSKEYVRVKVDTENYRQRRKDTLENLAKNLAYKVKRTKRPVSLEPMNPYERRIIHSALQNDKYVTTHSEGEEPYRKVVITPVK